MLTDATSAVVTSAAVELIQDSTGTTTSRHTNRDGIYVFPSVEVGKYHLKATVPGFRTAEIAITVQVGQTTNVDIVMQPGSYTQTIRVPGTAPVLRTTDSSVTTVIGRTLLNDLPMNGRRYTNFSTLTPNATEDGETGLVSIGGQQGGEDTGYANGNGANFFALDGSNASSNYFGNARGGERVPFIFGQNAIQEFAVAASLYSSAYWYVQNGNDMLFLQPKKKSCPLIR